MRLILSSLAAAVAVISPASAADLPVKARPPVPVAAEVWNWSGFYIGANGGYSWGRAARDVSFFTAAGVPIVPPVGTAVADGSKLDGGLFGGQIGYNWQVTNWVFGVETDAQWTGQRGSTAFLCGATATGGPCLPGLTFLPAGALGTLATVDQRLEWFGTFRGRLGVTVTPSVLLYATGGAAYGTLRTDVALASFTPAGAAVSIAAQNRDTRFGWTVGAGLEAMFAQNWSAKVEYLYMDLGSVTNAAVLPTAAGLGIGSVVNSRVTDNIIRAGINYHFSAGPGPVMARY
jgi:outer membrane immunogenic protein